MLGSANPTAVHRKAPCAFLRLHLQSLLPVPQDIRGRRSRTRGRRRRPRNPPHRVRSHRSRAVTASIAWTTDSSGSIAQMARSPIAARRRAGWICQAVPIDRASSATESEDAQKGVTFLKGLEEKLGRLQDEVASLKKEIAALREPPPPRPPADLSPQTGNGPDITIKLPTQEDVARAREFLEEAWRRLVEMFGTVRKDIMRKT